MFGTNPASIALAFVGGAVLGSFVLTLVERINEGERWGATRSRCDHCRNTLGPLELVPVVSFIFLRGRCRSCGKKIALWHLGVELLCGVLVAGLIVVQPELGPSNLFAQVIVVVGLVGLFVSDVRYGTVPDALSAVIAAALLFDAIVFARPLIILLLSGAAGAVFFGLQYWLSRKRWVGSGDIRLGLLAGLLLGWPGLGLALLLSYIIGSLIVVVLLTLQKKSLRSTVPLGAFLIPTLLVIQWFGNSLLALIWPI